MARDPDLDLVDDEDELEDDDELEEYEESAGTGAGAFLTGVVLGALIGAGVALMLAPERGEVVRRRLGGRLRAFGEDARDQLEDWRDEAGRELRTRRRRLKKRLKGRI